MEQYCLIREILTSEHQFHSVSLPVISPSDTPRHGYDDCLTAYARATRSVGLNMSLGRGGCSCCHAHTSAILQ